ncbi:hypothetical protein CDEF62S_03918 [Castellaniella defragrans]
MPLPSTISRPGQPPGGAVARTAVAAPDAPATPAAPFSKVLSQQREPAHKDVTPARAQPTRKDVASSRTQSADADDAHDSQGQQAPDATLALILNSAALAQAPVQGTTGPATPAGDTEQAGLTGIGSVHGGPAGGDGSRNGSTNGSRALPGPSRINNRRHRADARAGSGSRICPDTHPRTRLGTQRNRQPPGCDSRCRQSLRTGHAGQRARRPHG